MKKYLLGFMRYLFYKNISLFSLITYDSQISKLAKVNRFAKVFSSSIGDYSYIGSRSELVNVEIGKFCSIANECIIGMGKHTMNYLSTSPIFTEKKNGTGHTWINSSVITNNGYKVTIGNDVWIGRRVMIVGNVNIGNGVVIGAGSIVTKSIPDYSIAVGVPAKVINKRFNSESFKDKLLKTSWWHLPEAILKDNIELFQTENVSDHMLDKLID